MFLSRKFKNREVAHFSQSGPDLVYPESKKEEKIQIWLQSITAHCQWLITTFYYLQYPMEKIMEKMGWKNMHAASCQKYKCVQMLRKQAQKESLVKVI